MKIFVIIHKNEVFKERYFKIRDEARNFIKFQYPKRTFLEPFEDILVCRQYGTRFRIIELSEN